MLAQPTQNKAMDPVSSTVATETTKFALTKLWDFLARHIGYLSAPASNIQALTTAANKLSAKKKDIDDRVQTAEREGRTCTHQVTTWLQTVTLLEAEADAIKSKYEQSRCLWGLSFNCYCINRDATDKLSAVEAENMAEFESVAHHLAPPPVVEVPTASAVLGMDSYLTRVRSYLGKDSVGVIGIWGMGGVGKTRLLQSINNDELLPVAGCRSRTHFDHVIWATASRELNQEKLRKDVAKSLGLTLPDEAQSQANAIFSFLKNKSFLLLLDDLWEPVDLSNLGIPNPRIPVPGGRIKRKVVFTTRIEGVCAHMDAHKRIKVECLNDEDAWLLFQEKVGEETINSDARIVKLAKQVAKECDGLPLALIVIGRAMSTKKAPQEWQNAMTLLQRSRPHEIRGIDQHMFPKLMFSYDSLPDDIIRECFLCCALWPEDCSVWKSDLIECWLGHGLIDESMFDDINEAYDSGHSIIGSLKAACLLEPGDDEAREVKMHDVIRDLALWISSDCGMNFNRHMVRAGATRHRAPKGGTEWKHVKRISLIQNEMEEFPHLPPNCTLLSTLMLQENASLKRVPAASFASMPGLTYLDLSYTTIYDIPREIGTLVELQYLNLSHTGITALPKELASLRKLKFLLLRDLVHLVDIAPGALANLPMLRMLDLSHTKYEDWSELEAQGRGVKALGIAVETVAALQNLATLPHVSTWRLGIRKLLRLNQPLELLSPALLGSRNIRPHLQLLRIEHCETLEELSMVSPGTDDRQKAANPNRRGGRGGLQAAPWSLMKLETLELRGLPGLKKITWNGVAPGVMLPNLSILRVFTCNVLGDLSWVLRLPCLEELVVYRCNQMEQLINDEENAGSSGDVQEFPSLRRLCLKELPQLKSLGSRPFGFPALECLQVGGCSELKKLLLRPEPTMNKLKLIRGEKAWWDGLDLGDAAIKDSLHPHFKSSDLP